MASSSIPHGGASKHAVALHELCDPSAIDLDDSLLLSRFRTEYGSFFRRLTGSYRADRDRVRQHLRSREKPSVDIAVEVLEWVRAVRLAREEWDSHSDPLRLSLGDLFVGEATDFARIGSSVKAVRDRAGQWRGMATTIRERWTDREACEQVATEAPQLAASLDQLEELTSDLGGSTALGDQRRLSDVLDDLRVVRSAVERTDEVVRAYLGDFISAPDDLPMLQRWIEDLIRLQRIEAHAQTLDPELQRSLGDWFARRSTDWPKVLEAIAWAAALLDAVDQKPTRDLLARVSERDSASATAARTKLADSRARLDNRLNALNERFDVGRTEWPSWGAAPLSDLRAWASKLLRDAPRAASWVEYSSAVQRAESLLGEGIVDALRDATDVAEEAPPALDRLVFQSWIDRAHHEEPALKNFSTTDFERLRASFRELDGRFIEHARTRVRAKCLERYPDAFQTQVNAGEIGILRREIQKARRKMPVRRLLRRIPGLLTSLKPCFMMSPLAVSQLLPRNESGSESNLFDVVIFDEASQVFPEDAIPAIARANQLVVVGDTKQLPPTSFFRRRDDADDDDYDDELDVVDLNQLRDQESILHAMVGLVGQKGSRSRI